MPPEEYGARQALDRLTDELGQLPIHDQNFGLIHYDFEPDNLIWDGEHPGMIDFDDCVWYWFVADIAGALSDVFGDRASQVDFQNATYLRFIEGYRSVRQIEQTELELIPLFLRLQNLVTFTRLYRAVTSPIRSVSSPGCQNYAASWKRRCSFIAMTSYDEFTMPLTLHWHKKR